MIKTTELKNTKFVESLREYGFLFCKVYQFTYVEEDDYLAIQDNMGFIPDRRDIEVMVEGLTRFLENWSTEDIENFNEHKVSYRETCSTNETSSKTKEPEQGSIYFVQDDQGRVKIGRTKNLKQRLGEYTKLPYEPTLITTYEAKDYIRAEKLLHEHFADKRLRGEWFNLDEEDIKAIKEKCLPNEIISLVA